MKVKIAGNVIHVGCFGRTKKKKKCKNNFDDFNCLGIQHCEKKDLVDRQSMEDLLSYLKSNIDSLFEIYDRVLIKRAPESRKVVAENYYANDLYTVEDRTVGFIDYIDIEINRKRMRKIKAMQNKIEKVK